VSSGRISVILACRFGQPPRPATLILSKKQQFQRIITLQPHSKTLALFIYILFSAFYNSETFHTLLAFLETNLRVFLVFLSSIFSSKRLTDGNPSSKFAPLHKRRSYTSTPRRSKPATPSTVPLWSWSQRASTSIPLSSPYSA
jgi:hypothetical protein